MANPKEAYTVRGNPEGENKEAELIYLPSNVSLDIFYAPHMDREDFGDFDEFKGKIKNCDIFIPEHAEWNQNTIKTYNELASGNKRFFGRVKDFYANATGQRASFAQYELGLYEAIFNSRRRIVLDDVPHGHPLEKQTSVQLDEEKMFANGFDEAAAILNSTPRVAIHYNISCGRS